MFSWKFYRKKLGTTFRPKAYDSRATVGGFRSFERKWCLFVPGCLFADLSCSLHWRWMIRGRLVTVIRICFVFSVKQNERHVSALFLRVLSHFNISLHEGVHCPLLPLYQALTCWKISSKKQVSWNPHKWKRGIPWTSLDLGYCRYLMQLYFKDCQIPWGKRNPQLQCVFSPVSKTRISISTICSS